MISTRALTKRYGAVTAVQSVDLDVREGDRYGLLGPNGSGKTTLVRMLLGLVYATSGQIEVMGQRIPRNVREVLPQIGALIEEPAAYPHLSGRVNLALLDAAGPGGRSARRTRGKRIDEALEQVGLAGVGRRPVKAYSLGMRQRLGLAAALMRRPRLLILDEPGNGLDPRGIRDLRELIIGLNETGVTVFLSSHLLAEVEQLCTRVGVLDAGRLVLQDDLAVAARADRAGSSSTPRTPTRWPRCSTGRWSTGTGSSCWSATPTRPRSTRGWSGPGCGSARSARTSAPWRRSCCRSPGRARTTSAGTVMIGVELVKLLRRPRTWISVVLTCALPFVVAVFITITHLTPPPGQGSAFLSAVLQDGALYPAAALALVLPVFLPVAVAVVAGDSIAGEAATGHAPLPAGTPGRADPAAGGQARLGHRVRAARGAGGDLHRLRHRGLPAGPVPGRGRRAGSPAAARLVLAAWPAGWPARRRPRGRRRAAPSPRCPARRSACFS